MLINEAHCKPNPDGSICVIEGAVTLDESDVLKASSASGRVQGSAFEDTIKDLLCTQLKIDAKYPHSHEVMAASVFYQFGTNFQQWNFSVVTVTRFR